jgi:Uma2 family endonuclease
MTPSPFGKHQKALTRLAQITLNALESTGCKECEVAVELDWIIADDMVVRPDLTVCCDTDIDRFIEEPPTLIAEVLSAGTEHKDRTAKRSLYASEGVKYYLMIDIDHATIEMLEWKDGEYMPLPRSSEYTLTLTKNCVITLDLEPLATSL